MPEQPHTSLSRKFRNESGEEVDASFLVEEDSESLSVVLKSRGGKTSNPEYDQGLRILLRLLALRSATLLRVAVDSSEARALILEEKARALPSFSSPTQLSPSNRVELLRTTMQREQGPIAQAPGAKGGNNQRRIRLRVMVPGVKSIQDLERVVLGEETELAKQAREVIESSEPVLPLSPYDATNKTDARPATWRQIRARRGQPRFHNDLMVAYDCRCSISGCDAGEVLEAAHIQPYRGDHTHHVENGLLLRADLHTLFDRWLLTVASSNWTVLLSPKLRESSYGALQGSELRPMKNGGRPSTMAIDEHRTECGF